MFTGFFNSWKDRKRRRALKEFKGQLAHILHVNDDVLVESTKEKVREIIKEAEAVNPANVEESEKFLERAPLRVVKILPRQRMPTTREYADILAVAFMVAFGIRALYLQPFKIPTSSMQPTLFGIHYIADKNTLPNLPQPLHWLLYSTQDARMTVKKDGMYDPTSAHSYSRFLFFPRTNFNIGSVNYDLPGEKNHVERYYLKGKFEFQKDDVLCDGWLSLGDHLFVDRYTYHFRDPRRGEIVIFNTENLMMQQQASGFFYIKRMIGLPGDTLKVMSDEVYVREKGKSSFLPLKSFNIKAINRIYSGNGGYHGHLPRGCFAEGGEITVPEDSYFMMGDNSANSYDSRNWGFVPRRNIVGKAFFIFWPLSRRWGIPDKAEPLPFPTGPDSMELQ